VLLALLLPVLHSVSLQAWGANRCALQVARTSVNPIAVSSLPPAMAALCGPEASSVRSNLGWYKLGAALFSSIAWACSGARSSGSARNRKGLRRVFMHTSSLHSSSFAFYITALPLRAISRVNVSLFSNVFSDVKAPTSQPHDTH
jgi:hypothetical protein